jgi:hypothetical protein
MAGGTREGRGDGASRRIIELIGFARRSLCKDHRGTGTVLRQIEVHAALCSFACRIVSSVSRDDQRIGSNAEQATESVPTEAVVVAQPGRISSGIRSNAARIARLANEIERMGGRLREGFGPAGALCPPFARHFENGEKDPSERRKSRFQERSVTA